MYRRQTKPVNSFRASPWDFFKNSGVFTGCIAAALIIALGRNFLSITSSSLSGWSALFFLAVFAGVAIANWKSTTPFAGALQMLGFIVGCLTSLGALVSLEFAHNSVSDVLLGLSGLLLLPSLLGIRPRPAKYEAEKDPSVIEWSLRLDDLLKYEQMQESRAKIVNLLDALWRSPPDQSDFIPAQNQEFEFLLRQLENAIKTGAENDALNLLNLMTDCLEERNRLLTGHINIEYRNITHGRLLTDTSEKRPSH